MVNLDGTCICTVSYSLPINRMGTDTNEMLFPYPSA